MKKICLLTLALIICLSIVSCNEPDGEYIVVTDENGETMKIKKEDLTSEENNNDPFEDVIIQEGNPDDTDSDGDDKNWTKNY